MSAAAILANPVRPAAPPAGEGNSAALAANDSAFADLVAAEPSDEAAAEVPSPDATVPATAAPVSPAQRMLSIGLARALQANATADAASTGDQADMPAAPKPVGITVEDLDVAPAKDAPQDASLTPATVEDASAQTDPTPAFAALTILMPVPAMSGETEKLVGGFERQIDELRQAPEPDAVTPEAPAADQDTTVAKALASIQVPAAPVSDKLAALAATASGASNASQSSAQRLDSASNTATNEDSATQEPYSAAPSTGQPSSGTAPASPQTTAAPLASAAPRQPEFPPVVADAVLDPATQAVPAAAPQPAPATVTSASIVPVNLSTLAQATLDTTVHLAAQITRRLEGRSTRFELGLTPEGLGRVDVSLDIDAGGRLTARLAFDNPLAATELRGKADELRRELQDAGFTIAQDGLEFSERQSSSGEGFDRRQGRAFAGASRINAQADLAQPAPAAWVSLSLTPRGVDMKV